MAASHRAERKLWTTLNGMTTLCSTVGLLPGRHPAILDHGITVDEIPVPHRLAERGW